MFNQQPKYKRLYLDILKIGQNSVNTGLSFNDLKCKLEQKGYDFKNDCIELAVKQWFYDSFHHRGADDNQYKTIEDLDNHLDCNYNLKGESCLKLISYRASWFSMMTARFALAISFGAFIVGFWNLNLKMNETQKSTSTNQSLPDTNQLRQSNINLLDSYDTIYAIRRYRIDTLKK
jgi:hypothetical protein